MTWTPAPLSLTQPQFPLVFQHVSSFMIGSPNLVDCIFGFHLYVTNVNDNSPISTLNIMGLNSNMKSTTCQLPLTLCARLCGFYPAVFMIEACFFLNAVNGQWLIDPVSFGNSLTYIAS